MSERSRVTDLRPDESTVRFLNVDVELYGEFDRTALLPGFADAIVVLCENEDGRGGPTVCFELNAVTPSLPSVVAELIAIVRALPDDARAAWDAAARRVFNVGFQSGRTPHSTQWSIDANLLTALGELEVDLVVTVYGADLAGAEGGPAR